MENVFPDVLHYVNQLFWVNAVILYMNTYLKIPQVVIANFFGMSQYGVSKRYRSSKKKLKNIMRKPFTSRDKLFSYMSVILPCDIAEVMSLYYNFNLVSVSNQIISSTVSSISFTTKINKGMSILKTYYDSIDDKDNFIKLIKRYNPDFNYSENDVDKLTNFVKRVYEYISDIKSQHLYGSYMFKKLDKKRFDFDEKDLFGYEECN